MGISLSGDTESVLYFHWNDTNHLQSPNSFHYWLKKVKYLRIRYIKIRLEATQTNKRFLMGISRTGDAESILYWNHTRFKTPITFNKC